MRNIDGKLIHGIKLNNPARLERLTVYMMGNSVLAFSLIIGWDKSTSPPTPIYAEGVTMNAVCNRVEIVERERLCGMRRVLVDSHRLSPEYETFWYPEIEELPPRLFRLELEVVGFEGVEDLPPDHETVLSFQVVLDPFMGISYFFN